MVHSLGETLSSIEIDEQGRFIGTTPDLVTLGSVPNALTSDGEDLIVTLSGENSLLLLDRRRLTPGDPPSLDLGPGVNPMQTAVLQPGLYASTGFFTTQIHLQTRTGLSPPLPEDLGTGPSPQALLVLPPEGAESRIRLIAANTGYSSTRPSSNPFGPASLSLFTLSVTGPPENYQVTVETASQRNLEEPDHEEQNDPGLNPVALIDGNRYDPSLNELMVLCSGINYGSGNTDDGTLLVLNRTTLEISQRIYLGGSPGAAVIVPRSDGGHTLFAAGTTAVTSLQRRDGGSGWDDSSQHTEYTAQGGLPFLADIAVWESSIYVADFGNDRVLRFRFDGDGGLTGPEEIIPVSDGPAVLMPQEH